MQTLTEQEVDSVAGGLIVILIPTAKLGKAVAVALFGAGVAGGTAGGIAAAENGSDDRR